MFTILLSESNTTALITTGGILLGVILGPLLHLLQTTTTSRIEAAKERRKHIRSTMLSMVKNSLTLSSYLNAFVSYFENNMLIKSFNNKNQTPSIEVIRDECARLHEFLFTSVIDSIFDLPKRISDTANLLNNSLFDMMNYLDSQTNAMPGTVITFPEYEEKKLSMNKLLTKLIDLGRKELKK